MTRFFPTPTQPSITAEKSTAYSSSESTPQSITTQKSTAGSLPTVLSVTGVCVLLAGLMSFCLCVCSNKQKTERLEIYCVQLNCVLLNPDFITSKHLIAVYICVDYLQQM
ncbi:uncharacterized protein LOC128624981 isoform X2 [Ictalurus furcatus]|uniref:uncharacterized protein LOC128624981 isoform X2 n=1 Tax=Ictalurus furcatus TaxID=66913 RepID=UPI00234FFA99|nr:uncharacterized protein LOC128624981 isoform X2 [Ictalurus furcatus]